MAFLIAGAVGSLIVNELTSEPSPPPKILTFFPNLINTIKEKIRESQIPKCDAVAVKTHSDLLRKKYNL